MHGGICEMLLFPNYLFVANCFCWCCSSVIEGVVKFCGVEEDEVDKKKKWQDRANTMSKSVMVRSRTRQMTQDVMDGDQVDAPLLWVHHCGGGGGRDHCCG